MRRFLIRLVQVFALAIIGTGFLVDTSFAASLGWKARTSLREGLAATYRWYVDHIVPERSRAVA